MPSTFSTTRGVNNFDVALVLSQDTDLIEAIRLVAKDLRKTVGLVWLDGRQPDPDMKNAASFTRHLRRRHLAAALFPNPIVKPDGTSIAKPATW